jgi:hypothetical protein
VFNYLDTMIAMVDAGEDLAIIPSFVLPACRNHGPALSLRTRPACSLLL